MARNALQKLVTVAVTVATVATMFFGMAVWRRSQDADWCGKATASVSAAPAGQLGGRDLLHEERSACAVQRRRQRSFFGAVWRSDGPDMAACGFDWARLQLLSDQDPAAEVALLKSYGFDDPKNFDTSGGGDQSRFVKACLAKRQGRA